VHHKAILKVGNATGKPYNIQCSCGSGGDFNKETDATGWWARHKSRLGVVETAELVVPGAKKAPAPVAKPAAKPAPAAAPKPAVAKPAEVKKP
jgi:hypothetical protein